MNCMTLMLVVTYGVVDVIFGTPTDRSSVLYVNYESHNDCCTLEIVQNSVQHQNRNVTAPGTVHVLYDSKYEL